ncbi:MAG TPA: tripartite tricarboxylate transporter substrate binding protein [Casimicrobiaceae bacterium]|nr:tripartite tricarboxylate transporter substrate binding protein [Casimicrobiaceae bacterium]
MHRDRARRRFLVSLVAGIATFGGIAHVCAQDAWPQKPVRIVVPFAAGGATDVVARALGKDLGELWGQPVVIDNRGGAGGNIGADIVAKSAPDGYTILMTSGSILTVNPHIYAKMPFDAQKDFIPVTNVASGPQLVVTHPSVAAKNVRELIALAKAKPGSVNFGSAGIGSQTHMAAENFVDAAGISATHVPYKGEGPALADLIAGQIQFVVANVAAAAPHVANGTIRALAVTSTSRSPMMPDVPTVAESGVAGFENTGWFGLVVPAGTPPAVVAKLHADTVKVLERKEMRERLAVHGMAPVGNAPAAFAAAIGEESKLWAKVVKSRGLQVN